MDRNITKENETRERKLAYIRVWAELPLPDSAYDPRKGWRLDEFAGYCEEGLLREYKQNVFNQHFPHKAENRQVFAPVTMLHFPLVIQKRLLEVRFRVTGFRPGAYEPEEIPVPLLEKMLPVIELSELLDISERPARRRYELVRVIEPSRSKKPGGGRPRTYDRERLVADLRKERRSFETNAELVAYCQRIARPLPGKRGSKDGPDDATVRSIISKYGLEKLIKPEAQ